ncbi:hypothetical protein LTR78_002356 [Recurvomyces mirabilis]|uniref:Uncharacterized protein n=1 Tax=Recurvomyces mirabilis TaxID=574656 RepID=A0AAE1C4D3_9PEZI|nr:hypothetical protein LTR78_002356 [Recurvomyces mirabilis]KAK5157285.1 hypothetical protein LTS14_004050 [Recurvomyces mirabilis]
MADRLKDALRPGTTDRSTSHGRGGAGNIKNSSKTTVEAGDLATPTIKTDLYTTGRGGQGNMATNLHSHPEFARAAQDVEQHDSAPREPAKGTFHWGRGGQGNMVTLKQEGDGKVVPASGSGNGNGNGSGSGKKERTSSKGAGEMGEKPVGRRGSFQGVKSMLGIGKEKEKKEEKVAAVDRDGTGTVGGSAVQE